MKKKLQVKVKKVVKIGFTIAKSKGFLIKRIAFDIQSEGTDNPIFSKYSLPASIFKYCNLLVLARS